MNKDVEQIKALVEYLNKMTLAYDEGHPQITDLSWDTLYAELENLEKKTGYYLPNSPTQTIVYQVVNELKKVEHNHPMLSLDKTKKVQDIETFAKGHDVIAMPKMDGLSLSLRYINGKLVSAETRGDRYVGEDVTHNALVIPSIPKDVPTTDELIVDGEIICKYDDFKEFEKNYENPRNFAAGSIRLLDAKECRKRNLTFVAWEAVKGLDNSFEQQIFDLKDYGFTTVFTKWVGEDISFVINSIQMTSKLMNYPIDGVVFKFDSLKERKDAGQTGHHPKHSLAFKFDDVGIRTILRDIIYDVGRTGILCPVAIFDPIRIEGSTVTRASLHNLEVMTETLGTYPYVGQRIEVIKANQIIPQIKSAEKSNSLIVGLHDYLGVPAFCPICGGELEVVDTGGTTVLMCSNENCDGKIVNKLKHFCSRSGLNIKGLSASTLNKLIEAGFINSAIDIFNLKDHREEWIKMDGFGRVSVDKILANIEKSKEANLESFICALGIPLIGKDVAEALCSHLDSYDELRQLVNEEFKFSKWDGFGGAKTESLLSFDYSEADEIYKLLTVTKKPKKAKVIDSELSGAVVAITGKLKLFGKRKILQDKIAELGGKAVDSVSSKTTCLICNDTSSGTAKVKKAKELGIPVLTEEEFAEKFNLTQ